MLILVVNAGSSSLKYQVRDTSLPESEQMLTSGLVENIGTDVPNHEVAFDIMSEKLEPVLHGRELQAVGHRVVQGAEKFTHPTLLTEEVVQQIDDLSPLAPLHNPAHVQGMRAAMHKWPSLPQVAIFDTAFHSTMPEEAWRYAIPYDLADKYSIRRYGFHGTSHEYVSHVAADMLGVARDEFNGIVAHLGNGASVTAVKGGKSVDTSMGYTPLAGLIMGTRSGDIDPSALTTILIREGIDGARLDTILNKESGLLALAGSNDMRKVFELAESGDERAQLALNMTAYRLVKYIGGYNLVVGGAHALIFTAGIGENSGDFRKLVLDRLGALGVKYNEEENAKRSPEPRVISTEDSAIKVLVIPTNEEKAIAEATEELVKSL
ncbi:acetate kinase [uncultured Rothia sp.]|uniref:acetate/propionate family kinase n=1 Tax=uncultured Rothia sp. TaxID=316088 RepID=UPI0028D7ED82|nr:acetate kinase [uncultured Rothia sp.]